MDNAKPKTLAYKRSNFVTRLPTDYLYTPSHAWLARNEDGSWRAGLTRFATRMLGEPVDHGFSAAPGDQVECGQIVGWLEGFKAISDLYCVVAGEFVGGNPVLKERISVVDTDCYGEGWLYAVRGQPDASAMDVEAYRALLDKTIDKLMEKQKQQ